MSVRWVYPAEDFAGAWNLRCPSRRLTIRKCNQIVFQVVVVDRYDRSDRNAFKPLPACLEQAWQCTKHMDSFFGTN